MERPVLRDVPLQFESERLLIRCPAPGDGSTVHASVVESLTALRAFAASLPWALGEPSAEVSELFCRDGRANYLRRTDMPMLLFLKATGAHVGNAGLHRFDWSVPKCEVGFWLRSSYTDRGLMTEAVKAITSFARLELDMQRVEVLTDEANQRARRVCERAGFMLEGILRHHRANADGNLRNTCVYSIVA
jgi:RimJ/RimL family protein N-acetyltransferase